MVGLVSADGCIHSGIDDRQRADGQFHGIAVDFGQAMCQSAGRKNQADIAHDAVICTGGIGCIGQGGIVKCSVAHGCPGC